MLTKRLIAIFVFGSACIQRCNCSRSEDWPTDQLVMGTDECTVSHMTRYAQARGRSPIYFSTSGPEDMEAPSIKPLNSTAGEQWEFDGTSEDGTMALCFGFYRDPNYSFFGSGNLRVYAEFTFKNGSRYAVVEYAEESVVESCPGRGTRGTWRGDGWAYTFEISADMSQTRVTMKNPEANGTVVLTSVSPPRYANNEVWPSHRGSSLTVPHFYWVEPVPVAELHVNAVIHGEAIAWNGMGGHERLWGSFNWFTCLAGMRAVRILAGPYALSYVEFESAREKGLRVPSIMLAESGSKVFGSRLMEPSSAEDYFEVHKLYGGDGATTEALMDKFTGVELTLHSPGRQLQWRFIVTHKVICFEYNLGGGTGGTAYSGIARGGLVGSKQWTGPAFSEGLSIPQNSWILPNNYVE